MPTLGSVQWGGKAWDVTGRPEPVFPSLGMTYDVDFWAGSALRVPEGCS